MFGAIQPPPAYYTYAQQLVSRGHGLPLWFPDQTEAEIGDVGFIERGCFYRIFNIMHRRDAPINSRGVPDGFSPLQISNDFIHSIDQYLPAGPICASSTTCQSASVGTSVSALPYGADISYEFKCSGKQGAVALLGDSAQQKRVVRSNAFRKYMLDNHQSWHKFARRLDFDIRPQDIILVSGWVKTTDWAVATFFNQTKSHDLSISASYAPIAGAKFAASSTKSATVPIEQRSSKGLTTFLDGESPSQARNQCLFLNYFKMKHANPLKHNIRPKPTGKDAHGPSEYSGHWRRPHCIRELRHKTQALCHRDRDRSKGKTSGVIERNGANSTLVTATDSEDDDDETRSLDLLDPLLDHMLTSSSASSAIVNFEELYDICPLANWPSNVRKHLKKNPPQVRVDQHGVAVLSSAITAGIAAAVFSMAWSGITPVHTMRIPSGSGEREVCQVSVSTVPMPRTLPPTGQEGGARLTDFTDRPRTRALSAVGSTPTGEIHSNGPLSASVEPGRRRRAVSQLNVVPTPVRKGSADSDIFDTPTCNEKFGVPLSSRFPPSETSIGSAPGRWEPRSFLSGSPPVTTTARQISADFLTIPAYARIT